MYCKKKEHLVRAKFARGHVPQASLLKANSSLKKTDIEKIDKKKFGIKKNKLPRKGAPCQS